MNLPFVPKGISYKDSEDKKRLESRNGLIQAQFILEEASKWDGVCRLRPALLLELQRLAVNQIYRCAGYFRDTEVHIAGAEHQPPNQARVPELVDEMCDYIAREWDTKHAVHLASYLMWRVNWIHPFLGGNGRTARAASYLVLCAKLGFILPGRKTIPELIVANREPYFRALRAADRAWTAGELDLSGMEALMENLLAKQLVDIHSMATGKQPGSTG